MLRVLERAGGEPVSYAELRDAGIELPASVVSELELAGVPIDRCHGGAPGGRSTVGVRLVGAPREPEPEPEREPEPEPEPEPPGAIPRSPEPVVAAGDHDWTAIRVYRRGNIRLLAPIAVGLVIALVAVLVATGLSGGATRAGITPAKPRPRTGSRLATASRPTTRTVSSTAATTPTTTTPVSPTLATQLDSQGHSLLAAGQFAGAIQLLRRAIAATGEQQSSCLQPDTTSCLTYAYALYDLGRALRLSGDSTAAVPILEARLEIDNQRPVVAAELQLARAQAG